MAASSMPTAPRRVGTPSVIEEGATVRERQKILHIFDLNGPLQINVKVPEAAIAHVAPGMKARVKIDAFPNETLAGLIAEVAPLPDPKFLFDQTGISTPPESESAAGGRTSGPA